MRVKKITVNKLFGIFDHEISLNMSDRITILHGKNGVGKTTVLRLINGFFNSKYSELRSIPFEKLTIFFDNDTHLVIFPTKKEDTIRKNINFSLLENATNKKLKFFEYESKAKYLGSERNFPISMIDELIPNLERIHPRRWLYLPSGELLNLDDIVERFSEYLPPLKELQSNQPEWLDNIKNSICVRFIESQRLLNIADDISSSKLRRLELQQKLKLPSVVSYAEDLAENIQNKLAEYGKLSQLLDRTFPSRVFQQPSSIQLTDDELKSKLNELENKRNSLINAGLLSKDKDPNFQVEDNIDDSTRKLLSVYVEDIENKLNIFTEIAQKNEVFKRIINQKFSYKQINIDQEKGFIFTTEKGENLSPTDLSSGEQHELVMLYELLFKVKPNSLILIDEPELSLHVEWKIQFLKDLQEITKLTNIDIIIATHSPSLINDRWDLTVELKR
ncbi:AAA ATPase [Rippkaea orientalis PCC 8801]|uniref:AAA ATPase n=1 Tax=Rippkaea orientalis (strain PCC 8801 / RF-1) TaxID=41431 RepID=B7JXG0_RIPO1|nr:AAA family ATPase [Rippkaea orientalis]ACK64717.1 AAA ATPase [Rippkaea orientalis PCC 8801]